MEYLIKFTISVECMDDSDCGNIFHKKGYIITNNIENIITTIQQNINRLDIKLRIINIISYEVLANNEDMQTLLLI